MKYFQIHTGRGIACIGSLIAVFAFLSFPWVSLGFLGTYTGIQVAQMGSPYTETRALQLLWFALLIAGTGTGLSFLGFFCHHLLEPVISAVTIALGLFALASMFVLYLYLNQQTVWGFPLTTVLSTGFWVYAFTMLMIVAGGIIQLVVQYTVLPQRLSSITPENRRTHTI